MSVGVLPKEEIEKEIEAFDREVARLLAGTIPEEKFKRFRLQHGIYGQRQKGVQMVRVKIPSGFLNPTQLHMLADVIEQHSTGKGHLTTRQDIQFHFVRLTEITTVMRRLASVGLTTREACGNTVRNITACHLAGICPTELFDVTPYSQAVFRHLLRNPINQDLPRKFKISFSGCTSGCGLAAIHDIGLVATSRKTDEATEYGFVMMVAGGLGSSPKLAKPYTDFLPISALLPTCEAMLKVFDAHGDRKTRSKARMKFVLEKWGIDEFRRQVETQKAILIESGKVYPNLPIPKPRLRSASPDPALPSSHNGHATATSPYARWLRTNVLSQGEAQACAVQILLVVGNVTSSQLRALADISETFSPDICVTRQQNFILRHVDRARLSALYAALLPHGLAHAGAERTVDVIACPGTDSCQLGLTSSIGLGEALVNTFSQQLADDEDLGDLRIHISGCPNSCAQHHIAGLGLHGVAKKINGVLVPHYQLHLGGRVNATCSKVGKAAIKIPSKRIPEAVMEVIRLFREQRVEGETFPAFVDRFGWQAISTRLAVFTSLPPPDQASDLYLDYKSDRPFDLEDLGPGECAGTMIDLIENQLRLAGTSIEDARLALKRVRPEDTLSTLRGGILQACRALLVPFGIDAPDEREILKEFQHKVVEQGIVSERFEGFTEGIGQWAQDFADAAPIENLGPMLQQVDAFVEECRSAYDQMDAQMKLKKQAPTIKEETMENERYDVSLDLSGVACPMNFVKTKLKLEDMLAGQTLCIVLDEGEPIRNVPKSVAAEGHKVREIQKTPDGHYSVVIEKVGE